MASGRSCGSAGCGDDDGTLPPSPCASELNCWESSDSKSPNPRPLKTMTVESPPPPSSGVVDVVDDAPTPVLEDEPSEEKSPVPKIGLFHPESPPTPMVVDESLMWRPLSRGRVEPKIIEDEDDDIYGWGYSDEEGAMDAWAKLTGFKKEVFQDSDDDSYDFSLGF